MIWERLDHLSSELIAEAERKFAVHCVPVVSVDLDSISCPMVQGVPLWFCHLQWWRCLWDVWFCPDWGVVRIRCGWTWGGGDFIVSTRCGILYTIRRAGSQREETVPEAKIPPHCREWN